VSADIYALFRPTPAGTTGGDPLRMKDKDSAGRAERGAESWANETLPMGVRRELLDRQIQRFAAGRPKAQSRSGDGGGPAQGHSSERPQDG
jgi:hypothetical protein